MTTVVHHGVSQAVLRPGQPRQVNTSGGPTTKGWNEDAGLCQPTRTKERARCGIRLKPHLAGRILGGNMDQSGVGPHAEQPLPVFRAALSAPTSRSAVARRSLWVRGNDARLADPRATRRCAARLAQDDGGRPVPGARPRPDLCPIACSVQSEWTRAAGAGGHQPGQPDSRSSADIRERCSACKGQADRYHELLMPSQG